MRVLNVCETARGGVGTYQKLIAGLDAKGIDMHFLLPAEDAAFVGACGTRTDTFDRPRRSARALGRMVRKLLGMRRKLRPDVYFFHSTFALVGLLALRLCRDRTPALYCAHGWAVRGYGETSRKGRAIRAVEGRLSGLATFCVNVSQAERDLAGRLGYRGRHVVIENAVPEPAPDARDDLFAGDSGGLHLLFVGRLDRQKGFDLLAEGFAAAARERPDLRLHVVGAAVRGDAAAADLPANVVLHGWVDAARIDDWYRSADALIVPSRWEGLPLVIPEALRNGTPVLCARRSGMETLVTPGVTGGHFDLSAADIGDMLKALDRGGLRAMRAASRAAYEQRFAVDRLLDALASLLRDVARPGR